MNNPNTLAFSQASIQKPCTSLPFAKISFNLNNKDQLVSFHKPLFKQRTESENRDPNMVDTFNGHFNFTL